MVDDDEEEEFFEWRWDFYHNDDAFEDYMRELETKQVRVDSHSYCPSPNEIKQRAKLLLKMKKHGLSDSLVVATLVTETVHPSDVLFLIKCGHSPQYIEKKLKWWLDGG